MVTSSWASFLPSLNKEGVAQAAGYSLLTGGAALPQLLAALLGSWGLEPAVAEEVEQGVGFAIWESHPPSILTDAGTSCPTTLSEKQPDARQALQVPQGGKKEAEARG